MFRRKLNARMLPSIVALILVLGLLIPSFGSISAIEDIMSDDPDEGDVTDLEISEPSFEPPVQAPGQHGQDVSSIIKNSNFVSKVFQSDVEKMPGETIDADFPISIDISFDIPVMGDNPRPQEIVHQGDYAIIDVSKEFSLKEEQLGVSLPLTNPSTKRLMGHVTFTNNEGVLQARVDFDEGLYNNPGISEVSASLSATMWYDSESAGLSAGDHEILILGKNFKLHVPDVLHYSVKKTGIVDYAKAEIEWSVTIEAKDDNGPIDLAGYKFTDDLNSIGKYVDGSFKVGETVIADSNPAFSSDANILTFAFGSEMMSPQTVSFRTKIQTNDYLTSTEVTKYNRGNLYREDQLVDYDTIQVPIKPEWITKKGKLSGEPINDSGYFDPEVNTIEWTIHANNKGLNLNGVTIIDKLDLVDGLTFGGATLYEPSETSPDEYIEIKKWTDEPSEGRYDIGDISTPVMLKIVVNINYDEMVLGQTTFKNDASIEWKGSQDNDVPGGTVVTPGGNGQSVTIGVVGIEKAGSLTNPQEGIITWTVGVKPYGQKTAKPLNVYDLLIYGDESSVLDLASLSYRDDETEIQFSKDEGLTPQYHQKYNGNFRSINPEYDLKAKVYGVFEGERRVGDLLEVTGYPTKDKEITDTIEFIFDTLITDLNVVVGQGTQGDGSSSIKNTASVYLDNIRMSSANAKVPYRNKVLNKEVLVFNSEHKIEPETVDGANLYSSSSYPSGCFDYIDQSAYFRISVNAKGQNLSDWTNANGEKLSNFTVTDSLPEGWEFVMENGQAVFYIYEGEPADENSISVKAKNILSPEEIGVAKVDGSQIHFMFEELNKPYVIIVKARPTSDTLQEYFSHNRDYYPTNQVTLTAENTKVEAYSSQQVWIRSRVLEKSQFVSEGSKPTPGVAEWSVDYRPYAVNPKAMKSQVIDSIPEGLELRTTKRGELILDYIHVYKLNLDKAAPEQGNYVLGDELTSIQELVTYNAETRELSFTPPDPAQGYRLSYLTDVTGKPGTTVQNTVKLILDDEQSTSTSAKYVISKVDLEGSYKVGGWFRIKKTDAEDSTKVLKDAKFVLYSDKECTKVFRALTTDDNGLINQVALPEGTYYLKETEEPEGYRLDPTEVHVVEVVKTDDKDAGEPKFTVTIDGEMTFEEEDYDRFYEIKNFKEQEILFSKIAADNPEDQPDKQLAGVELQITFNDELKTPVDEGRWTIEEGAEAKMVKLIPGEYVLTELKTVSPYKLAKPVIFQVLSNGDVLVFDGEDWVNQDSDIGSSTVQMINERSELTVEGQKTWNDDNNVLGDRPESIEIHLLANGKVIGKRTVSARDNWSWQFTNLPEFGEDGTRIFYQIEEETVPHYTARYSGFDVINDHTSKDKPTQVRVIKTWNDDGDRDGMRPKSVTFKLFADGQDTGQEIVVTAADHWTGYFTDLKQYNGDHRIVYTIKELGLPEGYKSEITGSDWQGFVVTNSRETQMTEIAGRKIWDDRDNAAGARPESITINLLKNGMKVDSQTVTADSGWSWKFENLPRFEDGAEVIYSLEEQRVAGYVAEISGFDVINHYTQGKTSIEVTKAWADNDNEDGLRPDSVTIVLLANGEETGDSLVLSHDNGWSGTFRELDEYHDSEKIEYSVCEEAIGNGYTCEVSGDADTGFVVTNVRSKETIDVEGHKIWVDQDNAWNTRPDTITIRLLRNSEEIDVKMVTAEDGWSWRFENLPQFDGEERIVYSIKEDPVEHYVATIDGFDVINTAENLPTEPTKPTEPSAPSEPSNPTGPVEPTEPQEPSEPTLNPSTNDEPSRQTDQSEPLPQTGEDNSSTLWLALVCMLCGGALIILRRRLKSERS